MAVMVLLWMSACGGGSSSSSGTPSEPAPPAGQAPGAAQFSLALSADSLRVVRGHQGSSTITVAVSGGFNNSVTLAVSGAPADTAVTFNPSTLAAPGSGNSTMSITVGSSAPSGTFALTVSGGGDGVVETATLNLTIPAPPQVALSWDASESGDIVGYNVYRSTISGGPYLLMNTSPVPDTSYVDLAVLSGSTYYYVVTATNLQGVESPYSNQAVASVP